MCFIHELSRLVLAAPPGGQLVQVDIMGEETVALGGAVLCLGLLLSQRWLRWGRCPPAMRACARRVSQPPCGLSTVCLCVSLIH